MNRTIKWKQLFGAVLLLSSFIISDKLIGSSMKTFIVFFMGFIFCIGIWLVFNKHQE